MKTPALYLAAALFAPAAATDAAAAEPAGRPNLLLIVADDMGYGDLSCYGSEQIPTPRLDALAAGGVRCTDGYVSGSVCAPSRAGLLTGRAGSRFGFEHNLGGGRSTPPEYEGLPLDELTLADRLKTLGYRTGLVGKWHQGQSVPGHHPLRRGFDYFFGMLTGHHDYFPTVEKNKLFFGEEKPDAIRTPYLTDWFTLEALDFMHARGKAAGAAKQIDGDAPWFLFLSYNTPHTPMQAKAGDLGAYAHIKDKKRRAYCAMQKCLDENVGNIVDDLEAAGELENTLIAFISDNGGPVEANHAVNAPLWGQKGTFYEGGVRVPTIYHWPAKLAGGTVYEKPVSSLDVLATFVTAAGGDPPPAGEKIDQDDGGKPKIYDGVDLVPYFTGVADGDPHEALFWRSAMRGKAVRVGDWKLLAPGNDRWRLHDLREDVSERNNVIDDHPEIARDLRDRLTDWEVSLERNPAFITAPYWLGVNFRRHLKAYPIEQPAPDSIADIWHMGPADPADR